ncbi:MAG: aminotransferase class V-fold PLP-dependent enzyme [Ruminococcus sp.]|nr:aminotransferase class V-fold PLP-dependent enzyme [Ruminococcus sp.]
MTQNIINFDNAATTYPKPLEVRRAVAEAVAKYGNAGRGGHPIATRMSEMVYSSRERVAKFFDAKTENTVFTLNCTHALNLAIQRILKQGGHAIISDLEHNAVYRPIVALEKAGRISYTIAEVSNDDNVTLAHFRNAIRPNTRAMICTVASNVTGQILPYRELARLAKSRGICLIADGAQGAGILPLSLERDGISIFCTAGHKGLYGITGTGVLLTDGVFPIQPLMQDGTGSMSRSPVQPDFLPDRLESGTLNVIGAASLKAGIDFVERRSVEGLYWQESRLCQLFCQALADTAEVIIYRDPKVAYVPIVSFRVRGKLPEETAAFLGTQGFCLRVGLHCAPLAHEKLGTRDGTIRFAPSAFSREADTMRLVQTIKNYAKN